MEEESPETLRLPEIHSHIKYIDGIGNNLFAPENNMTRAEAARMFYNLLPGMGIDTRIPAVSPFPDVPMDTWYTQAVNTLSSLGFLGGFEDGSFRPEDFITRAEFVTLVVLFDHETNDRGITFQFTDVPASHWAYEYINTAITYGWIAGYGDGSFMPDRLITRAEAVTLANKVFNRVPDRVFIETHPGLTQFTDVPQTHWAFYEIMEAYHFHMYIRRDDGLEEWQTAD